jgi:DNA-binding NtrC family response regulator
MLSAARAQSRALSESPVGGAGVVREQLEQPLPFSTQEAHHHSEVGERVASADDHLSAIVRDAEKQALQRALAQCGGKRSDAARVLGLSRSTFYAKLKQHGLARLAAHRAHGEPHVSRSRSAHARDTPRRFLSVPTSKRAFSDTR